MTTATLAPARSTSLAISSTPARKSSAFIEVLPLGLSKAPTLRFVRTMRDDNSDAGVVLNAVMAEANEIWWTMIDRGELSREDRAISADATAYRQTQRSYSVGAYLGGF